MEEIAGGDEVAAFGGVFERPGFSAVEAAGEPMFFGLFAVDVVAVAEVLVIAPAETEEDFVAPRPNAVIGRPAAETPRLVIDHDVMNVGRALSGGEGCKGDEEEEKARAEAQRRRAEKGEVEAEMETARMDVNEH